MNDIVILSPDELFARMLTDECTFCGFPAKSFPVADEHVFSASTVLIDLDHIRTIPASATQVIGFLSEPDTVPDEVRSRCRVIFHRPFPMSELRGELYRLFPAGTVKVSSVQKKTSPSVRRELTLDPIHMCAVYGDFSVPLSYHELTLLGRLLAADGETVSKGELSVLLGGHASNMTETYVCRLRRKIEKALGIRIIESVRGVGYRCRKNDPPPTV